MYNLITSTIECNNNILLMNKDNIFFQLSYQLIEFNNTILFRNKDNMMPV